MSKDDKSQPPSPLQWDPLTRLPLYWQHEQSGRLRRIILKFLKREPLSNYELNVIRWYVHQWVEVMPTAPPNYSRIKSMSHGELADYVFNTLVMEYGIDPF